MASNNSTQKRLSKFRKRKVFRWLIAITIVLLSLFLIFFMNKIEYALILLLFLVIGFLVWKAYIQRNEERDMQLLWENEEKERQIKNLKNQLESQRQSSLNLEDVRNVFKVINQEVEFSFYRPVRHYEDYDVDSYTFNGIVKIEGKALFGVDFDNLKYKIESGILYVGQEKNKYAISCEFTPTWTFQIFLKDSKVKHRKLFGDKYIDAKENDYTIRRLPELSTELMKNVQEDITQRRITELTPNIEQTKVTLQNVLANKFPEYKIELVDVEAEDSSYQLLSSLKPLELNLIECKRIGK